MLFFWIFSHEFFAAEKKIKINPLSGLNTKSTLFQFTPQFSLKSKKKEENQINSDLFNVQSNSLQFSPYNPQEENINN